MTIGDIKKSKLVAFTFAFVIIFNSGHAFQTTYNQFATYALFFFSVVLVGFLALFAFSNNFKVNTPEFMCVSFLIPMVLTAFFDSTYHSAYIFMFCTVFIGYCVAKVYSFDTIVSFYLKLITVVTFVAIVGSVLYNNTTLLDWLPRVLNSNGREYAVGAIFNVMTAHPDRNSAMFWEPGIFATALGVGMVFEILFKKAPISKLRIILFIAGFISATSSAGYIVCMLSLLLLVSRKMNVGKKIKISNILGFLVMVTAVIVFLNFDYIILNTSLADNKYVSKLLSENIRSSSRYTAIAHNLKIFYEYPVFGAGLTYVSAKITRYADTSTVTYLMSLFGIMGIWYTISWVIGIFRIKSINFMSKVLLLLIVMVILNKEPHLMIVFTWVLLFYLYAPKKENNRLLSAKEGAWQLKN